MSSAGHAGVENSDKQVIVMVLSSSTSSSSSSSLSSCCVEVFDFHQEADGMEESGRGQKQLVAPLSQSH